MLFKISYLISSQWSTLEHISNTFGMLLCRATTFVFSIFGHWSCDQPSSNLLHGPWQVQSFLSYFSLPFGQTEWDFIFGVYVEDSDMDSESNPPDIHDMYYPYIICDSSDFVFHLKYLTFLFWTSTLDTANTSQQYWPPFLFFFFMIFSLFFLYFLSRTADVSIFRYAHWTLKTPPNTITNHPLFLAEFLPILHLFLHLAELPSLYLEMCTGPLKMAPKNIITNNEHHPLILFPIFPPFSCYF